MIDCTYVSSVVTALLFCGRHTGDLGNIEEDANGNVMVTGFSDSYISLFDSTRSIIDRAIVVRNAKDIAQSQ